MQQEHITSLDEMVKRFSEVFGNALLFTDNASECFGWVTTEFSGVPKIKLQNNQQEYPNVWLFVCGGGDSNITADIVEACENPRAIKKAISICKHSGIDYNLSSEFA